MTWIEWLHIAQSSSSQAIIIIIYLRPYNYVQTNDYNQIEIITWNYIICNTPNQAKTLLHSLKRVWNWIYVL